MSKQGDHKAVARHPRVDDTGTCKKRSLKQAQTCLYKHVRFPNPSALVLWLGYKLEIERKFSQPSEVLARIQRLGRTMELPDIPSQGDAGNASLQMFKVCLHTGRGNVGRWGQVIGKRLGSLDERQEISIATFEVLARDASEMTKPPSPFKTDSRFTGAKPLIPVSTRPAVKRERRIGVGIAAAHGVPPC
ncbi:hypothetical protein GCM10007036_21190 [Alsobacter metallidurans]|uniref:Uncharacterized protein n=1 Tax=Alsobacter metallidurans TaxID=340221 RepID=A0A917MI41_9HYPH|nr:hypothetical protein GCM10007036_21190 [Alsobacter metallidurans]